MTAAKLEIIAFGGLTLVVLLAVILFLSCYFYLGKQVVGTSQQPLIGAGTRIEPKTETLPEEEPEESRMYYIIRVKEKKR